MLLQATHLSKIWPDFSLRDLSFTLNEGEIVSLIGENGSGKSSLIRIITNILKPDTGKLTYFDNLSYREASERIGIVFDHHPFPPVLTPCQIKKILSTSYRHFDLSYFNTLMDRFDLPLHQPLSLYSRGMSQKFNLICALSHHPRLLILDEATSGLDAVVRYDILELLLDFVQNESRSVLMATHISSEVEQIADRILYLKNGQILLNETKETLLDKYGLLKISHSDFESINHQDILYVLRNDYSVNCLVENRFTMAEKYPNCLIEPLRLDSLLLMYAKGEKQ